VRHVRRGEARLDVLERRQGRDQVELLEDEAKRTEPQLGQRRVGQRAEVTLFEEDVPLGGPIERAEQLQQRRLAGSTRALESDELPAATGRFARRNTRVTSRSS
jgi:hypothetical protein